MHPTSVAVKLDALPGPISGSPIFIFSKLTSGSCTISSRFPDVSSLIASPLSTISCSILAGHSSVCCPFPTQPDVRTCPKYSVASTFFSHVYRFPTHPFVGLLVSTAYSLLLHSTDCQHTDSRIANPKHYHLPDISHIVSSLHLLASTAEIHRCSQACRQKLLASTSCSTWFHPQNAFAPSTLLQMAPLLQCGPCLG